MNGHQKVIDAYLEGNPDDLVLIDKTDHVPKETGEQGATMLAQHTGSNWIVTMKQAPDPACTGKKVKRACDLTTGLQQNIEV